MEKHFMQGDLERVIAENTPVVLARLYGLLDAEDLPPKDQLAVIREILDRTIGKGGVIAAPGEETTASLDVNIHIEE